MLRHLVRSFHRSLILQIQTTNGLLSATSRNNRILIHSQRTLYAEKRTKSTGIINAAATDENEDSDLDTDVSAITEMDSEYVQPYRTEHETRMTTNSFVEALRTRFRLSGKDMERILENDVVRGAYKQRSLIRTLDELCMLGVTKRSFMDSPWLITLDQKRLEQKIELIRSLPLRDINHFVPFLHLTVPRLRRLTVGLNRESKRVPHGNRVYYIAEQLKVDPYVISMYLSKRLFILEMPYDMLEQNLQHLIDYNVSAQDILRDLWAFRYTPKSVQMRLERAKIAKKDKIMPWMVRCPESILQRSLQLTTDELAVLGDKHSTVEYMAERLGFDVEQMKAIMAKHPQVFTVRVTKIKEVLDYLLDEAGFAGFEIAQVPRILCHSLETTKHRIEELKAIGCRPSTLIIVCRSKREYDKFLKAWIEQQSKSEKAA